MRNCYGKQIPCSLHYTHLKTDKVSIYLFDKFSGEYSKMIMFVFTESLPQKKKKKKITRCAICQPWWADISHCAYTG